MTKIRLEAGHKWILELIRRVNEEIDLSEMESILAAYKQCVKKWYGFNLDVVFEEEPLGRVVVLEMSDKDATWFIMQHGGSVLSEDNMTHMIVY